MPIVAVSPIHRESHTRILQLKGKLAERWQAWPGDSGRVKRIRILCAFFLIVLGEVCGEKEKCPRWQPCWKVVPDPAERLLW